MSFLIASPRLEVTSGTITTSCNWLDGLELVMMERGKVDRMIVVLMYFMFDTNYMIH